MTIPIVTINKEATLLITLRDSDNAFVINRSVELAVTAWLNEAIFVKPIEEVGSGTYKASFTASKCGFYTIWILYTVDGGFNIAGSPYK